MDWTFAHWEELLQSVSDFIFSKHCGYRSRGVRGVKRPEILWEIQKYSLPGRPSSQNWVKSKTICHFLRNFDEFLNGFWFYSIMAGWSTWQWVFLNLSQNFWSFDTPDTPGCASAVIWNHCLKHTMVFDPRKYYLELTYSNEYTLGKLGRLETLPYILYIEYYIVL